MSDVIVLTHGLGTTFRERVLSACETLGLRAASWNPGDARPADASVVVAGLGAGERAMAAHVTESAELAGERVTLLLAADEPLVRAEVSLQRGRVVLVERALTQARLEGTLRALAAGERSEIAAEWRVLRRASAWLFWSPPAHEVEVPGRFQAVLPFDGDVSLEAGTFDALTAARDEEVASLIGARAGLVHLDETGGWTFYWPCADRPLWIHSPRRLPRALDLAAAAALAPSNVVRLRGEPGDVAVAFRGAAPFADASGLDAAISDGAAALVHRLGGAAGGVVVEVR